ncbi:MAG TPA: Lrp/AsnC family transcriptional regulator [Clostridia bacterium]|nr:Lrp/AsnC family transcriptional regulator [Clostridia bacterium]
MDLIDTKIINCLSENSRINASEIAEKVKLSVSAVIERIKKLETNGTIKQYTLILNNDMIGRDVSAMISVNLDHPRFNQSFEAEVKSHAHITECYYMAGDYDYMLKVVTHNTKSLERVLNDIKSVQGVSKTRTMIVLSSVKEIFTPPLKVTKSK